MLYKNILKRMKTNPNWRNLFKKARLKSPAIIFIDEIDSLGKERGSSAGTDVINQLLTEMDGFTKDSKILVIGCTNLIHQLDKALIRPGRFDRLIEIPRPNKNSRKKLFEYYLKKIKYDKRIDREFLIDRYFFFSSYFINFYILITLDF